MTKRGTWQGLLTIVRFNWPFYASSVALLIVAIAGVVLMSPGAMRILSAAVVVGIAYMTLASLVASHLIYDRSDLYRFDWLAPIIDELHVRNAIVCHAGFDETSSILRGRFSDTQWQVLDHFDEARMTEASIRRAQNADTHSVGATHAPHNAWPVPSSTADLIIGMLAIHELRTHHERCEWFAEARRTLRPSGRTLVVEHVRDFANSIVFGPGFLHFHSPSTWRRSWQQSGFVLDDELRITPWVRVFVLRAA